MPPEVHTNHGGTGDAATHMVGVHDLTNTSMKLQWKQKGSQSSIVLRTRRLPQPVYFQSFDCVGIPGFLMREECQRIIDAAEEQRFTVQRRHRLLNLQWTDIVDPFFAEGLWQKCGLEWFFRKLTVDGMVACGLNDVIRIQKYVPGSVFGRHIDQHVQRVDGRVSKYSLRVYLNSQEDEFEGGLSTFHVPFRPDPIAFEPELGLALLYPQGEFCTTQEENEVIAGCKYLLRADVLFTKAWNS